MCRGWACAGLQPQNMTLSARFLISPSVQLGIPTSWMAIRDDPWHTVAQLSTMPPTFSAISWPMDIAWQLVEAQPYIRVFRDFTSILAVKSIASS